jgi:4-cresol dehydrogenase (hydroxylating)
MLVLETTARCLRTPIIRFGLEEAGLAYRVEVRPDGHFTEQLGTLGPLLRDGPVEVLEVEAILRHVGRMGPALLPSKEGLPEMDRWLAQLCGSLPANLARARDKDPEARAAVTRTLESLEARLADRPFLLGAVFTLADLPAAAMGRLADMGWDLARLPKLAAYAARVMARPAWARANTAPPTGEGTDFTTELTAILGPERMSADPVRLARAGRTTLGAGHAPEAILRPARRADVPGLIAAAARHRKTLHPISRGKNWGFGDAAPPRPGRVLLDLSDIDRIVEVDEELGVAVIEPGVTQARLAAHLNEIGSAWRLDCAGAGAEVSITGNLLERGTSYGAVDRPSLLAGMEVVLGDGSTLRTGFLGHPAAARTGRAHKSGLGPSLEGLFFQSSLGVVTEIGLWLSRRPERVDPVFIVFEDGALAQVVDRLRTVRLDGFFLPNIHAFALPIPGQKLWMATGALEGSPALVEVARGVLIGALAGVARVHVGPATLAGMPALGLPADPMLVGLAGQVEQLLVGRPAPFPPEGMLMFTGGPAIQKPNGPITSGDPCEQGYGLSMIWHAAAAVGAELERLVALNRATMMGAGFPPLITMQLPTPRAAVVVSRLVFDKKDPAAVERAARARRDMIAQGLAAGFPPCRLGNGASDALAGSGLVPARVLDRLAAALDPGAVFGPGRYPA